MELLLIKLGGAYLTDKTQYETILSHRITNIARSLHTLFYQHKLYTIIVHGAGSFGHFQAKHFQIPKFPSTKTSIPTDNALVGFADCRRSVAQLNQSVLAAFIKERLPAISIDVSPKAGEVNHVFWDDLCDSIMLIIQAGGIPVLHGDALMLNNGAVILSGDSIMCEVAKRLNPQRCVFLTNVKGVMTGWPDHPELLKEINVHIDSNEDIKSVDVTGGMRAKVESAIELSQFVETRQVWIVGPEDDGSLQVFEDCVIGRSLPENRTLATSVSKKPQ